MKYYFKYDYGRKRDAGPKAKVDAEKILERTGFKKIEIYVPDTKNRSGKLRRLLFGLLMLISYLKAALCLKKNSVLAVQHPMSGIYLFYLIIPIIHLKHVNIISIIHDMDSIRNPQEGKKNIFSDRTVLRNYSIIICHNNNMKNYLIHEGIASSKIVSLGIFDYLTDVVPTKKHLDKNDRIVVAGNLVGYKAGYIYKLEESNLNLPLRLYGPNFQSTGDLFDYKGVYPPDELPARLVGSYGLIWDGHSINTCSGNTGNYLRFNDPHKLSLYLVSGLPIIIWSEAALANFVIDNGLGITVDSLNQINDKVKSIGNQQYNEMVYNVQRLSKKIRNGFFLKNAIEESLKRLKK